MYRDSESGLVFHRGRIGRSAFAMRLLGVVNFLFGVLYVLFGMRFLLDYIEARPVPFVAMIDASTNELLSPFRGIVANGHDGAGHPLVWWILIGAAVYLLAHAAIIRALRAVNHAPHAHV
jgi:uncharacterized protein YggT (Ycf19 family)